MRSLGKVNGYQKRPISQVTYPPSRLFPEAKNGTVKKRSGEMPITVKFYRLFQQLDSCISYGNAENNARVMAHCFPYSLREPLM